jgi:hypothetical protein
MRANVDVLPVLTEKRGLDPDVIAGSTEELSESAPSLRNVHRGQRRELGNEHTGAMRLRQKRLITRVVGLAAEHSVALEH